MRCACVLCDRLCLPDDDPPGTREPVLDERMAPGAIVTPDPGSAGARTVRCLCASVPVMRLRSHLGVVVGANGEGWYLCVCGGTRVACVRVCVCVHVRVCVACVSHVLHCGHVLCVHGRWRVLARLSGAQAGNPTGTQPPATGPASTCVGFMIVSPRT